MSREGTNFLSVSGPLMSRDEVAALLGIAPESVRKTLGRYGIAELRGYPRDRVQGLRRLGRGHRGDLERRAHAVQKIPTLFLRDPDDRRHVLREVNPAAAWVLDGEAVATRKYDGTCLLLDTDGDWWARREVKPGKSAPAGYREVETDPVTGKTVGWEPVGQSPFARFWREAMDAEPVQRPGTYELIGPKVNGNPEGSTGHRLVWHNAAEVLPDVPLTFDGLQALLTGLDYEGIVWHHPGGRMAKLKRRDFPVA